MAPAAVPVRRPAFGLMLALILALIAGFSSLETRAAEHEGPSVDPTPFDASLVLQARALRGLRTEVAVTALAGDEGGDLSLAVLAVPIPSATAAASVPVFVEIDGASFLQHQQGDLARLEVYVYAVDADKRIVDFLAEAFVVDVAEQGERIWQSGLEFFGRLELPPGSYSLRVLVRNFQSRAQGLRTFALEVPAIESASPLALTPLVSEPTERDVWLPVRSWREVESSGSAYPLALLGLSLNPAVRPVLAVGRQCEFVLPVRSLAAGLPEASLELVPLVAGPDADVTTRTSAEVVSRRPSPLAGFDLLTVRLPVPEVPQGVYRARLRLGGSRGAILSQGLEVLVVDAETRERDLLWSDLRWLLNPKAQMQAAAAPAPAPETKRAARRETRRERKNLALAYRGVLAHLASGTAEAARGALFEFESETVRGSVADRLGSLLAAELSVAADLGRSGSELLVPLVLLHREMYERYRGRRRYALLAHTRELLEQLADLFVERGGSQEIGADMLSSLAGVLQDANLVSSCRHLFVRALEYDPDNPAALLGLAATFEKYGEYQPVLDHLEHLVSVAPDLDEARLRLALALNRVGLRSRARELLEGLVESGRNEWVRAVAYEESGRILLQTGAVAAAAELLEEAVAAMPGRQGLRVLAAHAYDRLGRTNQALEHLAAVVPAGHGTHSERLEYDRWPHSELDRIHLQLADLGRQAMAALGDAVAEGDRKQRDLE